MPEPKKRQSPVVGQNRSSKLVTDTGQPIQSPATPDIPEKPEIVDVEPVKEEIAEKCVPLKDMMRTEPLLLPIVVSNYEGGRDDNGFYHDEGSLVLNGGVLYKGLFTNGKMQGVGEMTWPNGVSYCGEFHENQITGKGVYVWKDGSSYEGDVLDGLRHGHGTYKCADQIKSYKGQWKDGKRHGKGISHYDLSGESYYDGEWIENQKSGFGVRRFKNGNIYEGNWECNIRDGQGTMCWYDLGQEYTGDWSNGLQNGQGEITWYLKRVSNTQYPLRNYYVGKFLSGVRNGYGTFYYASGAKYEGGWRNNMKNGHGIFTFKNGCVFRGEFSDDHMIDFPDVILSGMATPDISRSGIPIESPTSMRAASILGIPTKATDVFLEVEIDEILMEYSYDLEQREGELDNILRILLRYASHIKQIYKFYSCIGLGLSVDNTAVMNKLQYYRFMKDHGIHNHGHTLMDMDKYLGEENNNQENCFKKIFLRDFLNSLIRISYLLFKNLGIEEEVEEEKNICSISQCFQKLLEIIFKSDDGRVGFSNTKVNGCVYSSLDHSLKVNKRMNQLLEVYYFFTILYLEKEEHFALTQHQVMFLYKELGLFGGYLTSTKLVQLLTKEESKEDGFFNLNKTISPLEFVEVLVDSASHFVSKDILKQHVDLGEVSETIADFLQDPLQTISNTLELANPLSQDTNHHSVEPQSSHGKTEELSAVPTNVQSDQISNKNPIIISSQSKLPPKYGKKGKSETRSKMDKDQQSSLSSTQQKPKSKVEKKTSSVVKTDGATKSTKSTKPEIHLDPPISSKEHFQQPQQQQSQLSQQHENSTSILNEPVICNQSPAISTEISGNQCSENNKICANTSSNVNKEESEVVPSDDFEIWACRLDIFIEHYLLPAFAKRKEQEEALQSKVPGLWLVVDESENSPMGNVPIVNYPPSIEIEDTYNQTSEEPVDNKETQENNDLAI